MHGKHLTVQSFRNVSYCLLHVYSWHFPIICYFTIYKFLEDRELFLKMFCVLLRNTVVYCIYKKLVNIKLQSESAELSFNSCEASGFPFCHTTSSSHCTSKQAEERSRKRFLVRNWGSMYITQFLIHCLFFFTHSFCVTLLCTELALTIVEVRDAPVDWLTPGAKTEDSNGYHTEQRALSVFVEAQIERCAPSGRRS